MRLVLPVGIGLVAASSCCCGGLLDSLHDLLPLGSTSLENIPAYPGAELESSGDIGNMSTNTYQVVDAAPSEVVEFHLSVCDDHGWAIITHADVEGSSVLQCGDADHELSVTASDRGESVGIVVTLETL